MSSNNQTSLHSKAKSTRSELHDVNLPSSSSSDKKQTSVSVVKNHASASATSKSSVGTAATTSHGHKSQSRRIPLETLPNSGVNDPRSDPPNIKLNINLPLPHFATKRHSGAVPFPTSIATTKTLSGSSRFDFKNDLIHSTALSNSGAHSHLQRQLSSSGSDISTSHLTAANNNSSGLQDPDLTDDLMSPPPIGSASLSTANGPCPWSSSSIFGVGPGDSLPSAAPTTDIFGESLSPVGPGDRVRASFEERIRALDDKFVELDRMIRVTKERPAHRSSVDYSKYKVIKKTSSSTVAGSAATTSSATAAFSTLPQQTSPFMITSNSHRTASSSSDLNTPSSSSSSKFSLTATIAKSSVFDQDAERLSSIEEKYTAKPYTCDLSKVKVDETSERAKIPLTINIPQPAPVICQEMQTAPASATTPSTPLSPSGNPIQGILKKTSISGGQSGDAPPKTPTLTPFSAQQAFVLPVSPQDPRTAARRDSALLSPTSLPRSDPRLGRSLSVSGPSPAVTISPSTSTSTTTPSTSANTPQKSAPETPLTPVKSVRPEKSPSVLIPTSTCAPITVQKTTPLQTKTPLSRTNNSHDPKTSSNQVRTYCSNVNLTSTPTIAPQFQKAVSIGDSPSLTVSPSVVTKELRNKELDELFNNSTKMKSDSSSIDCLKKNRPVAVDKEKAQLPKIMKKSSATAPPIRTESTEKKAKVDETKEEKHDKTKKEASKSKNDATATSKRSLKSNEKEPDEKRRQLVKKKDEKSTTANKQTKEESSKKSSVHASTKSSSSKSAPAAKKSDKNLKIQSSTAKNLKIVKKPLKTKRKRMEKYESDGSSQETDGDGEGSVEENRKVRNKSDNDSDNDTDEKSGSGSSTDDDDETDPRTKKDRKIAKNLEKEWKKILQESGEPVGLSMYDRVKRRSSAVNQTSASTSSKSNKNKENKKSEKGKFDKLREIRREKNIKKKCAPKRIKCSDSSSNEASSAEEHTSQSESENSDSDDEKEVTKVKKTTTCKKKEPNIPSKLSSNDLFSSDASTPSAQSSNEDEKEDETMKTKTSKTMSIPTKKPIAAEKTKSPEKSLTKQKQQATKKRRHEESDGNNTDGTASGDDQQSDDDRKRKRKVEKSQKQPSEQEKPIKEEENRKRKLSESSVKQKTNVKRNKTTNEEQKTEKETGAGRVVTKGAKKEIAPSTIGRTNENSGDATVKQHVLVTKAAKKALDFGSTATESIAVEKCKMPAKEEDDDDATKGAIQSLDNVEISADIVEALKRSLGEDVDLNETTEFDAPVELSVQEVVVAEETDTPATTEPTSPSTVNNSVANAEVKNVMSEKEKEPIACELDNIKSPDQ
uniref:Uncharacterized protein n=1 Tax=Romanomermis culicivorax TaxID=13658 RepID=A0A915J3M3_ROMCU